MMPFLKLFPENIISYYIKIVLIKNSVLFSVLYIYKRQNIKKSTQIIFQIKNDEKNSGEYVATAQIAKLGGGVFFQIHYLSLATSWRIVKCLYSLF